MTQNVLELFGVDKSKLESHAPTVDFPDTVPGRVLHIDGDFLAYQVSGDEEKPLNEMKHNHDIAVETLRLLAGAETAVSHLTAAEGDKGNRFEIAIQKEYQANRKEKQKPKHLHTIKSWMEHSRGAISHVNQEADDGLCQANYDAVAAGTPELSVLVSRDKDLQMCPGWHLDWMEGTLEFVDGFGYIELDRSKSSPKIVGKGTAYFWSQMLSGDTADNIQGIPMAHGPILNKVDITGTIQKAMETLKDPDATDKQKFKAQTKLTGRKPKKCGPVLVYEILKGCKTDREAFNLVRYMYKQHGECAGFKHWATGEEVDWKDVFMSEANLLWMRRKPNEKDIEEFINDIK